MDDTHKSSSLYSIKFLYPYLEGRTRTFAIILFAMMVVAITSALTAYIFKYILNDIFIDRDEQMLVVLPLVVILLFSIRGTARFASMFLTAKVGASLASRLRQRLFAALMGAEYRASKAITTGDINAVTIQTVLNIQNSVARTLPQLLVSALTVVALIVMILCTDWRLSLYAIAVALLIVVPVKILGKGAKRHAGNSESMISELSNRTNESLNNLDLVKVHGGQAYECSLFDAFLAQYETFQIKLAKYQLLSSPFMEFFVAFAIALVIHIGGHYVIDGSMSAGDFFAFLIALMMLYAPIKNLTQNYMALYALNSYVERVEQILALPQEQPNQSGQPLEKINSIAFRNLSYAIEDTPILHDVSFVIEVGDSVAIVGKSGAGKSSLISLLFGLATPTAGSILINHHRLENYLLDAFRQQISYVNQSASIFNTTIQENILYGDALDHERYDKAKEQAQCGFIEQVPGRDQATVGEFGNRLSGGQRQRIALARAIYRSGSLFVLDEATSALDANTESLIQQSLKSVMQERTTIIIAHRLATIEKCNKVMVLEAGRVVAFGNYDEVSRSSAFERNFMIER